MNGKIVIEAIDGADARRQYAQKIAEMLIGKDLLIRDGVWYFAVKTVVSEIENDRVRIEREFTFDPVGYPNGDKCRMSIEEFLPKSYAASEIDEEADKCRGCKYLGKNGCIADFCKRMF